MDDEPPYVKQLTPYEHFREAEHYLASARTRRERLEGETTEERGDDKITILWPEDRQALALDLEFAAVHATLATVQRAQA